MVGLGYLGVLAPNLPESHGMGISADGVVIVGYSTTPRVRNAAACGAADAAAARVTLERKARRFMR